MLNNIDKQIIYISLIFIITCVIICAVIIYPIRLVNSVRVENIELERENSAIQNEIDELKNQNEALTKLNNIDIPIERVSLIELFTSVQNIFKINSINIISSEQDQEYQTIKLKLEGDYYIFAASLAELRLLKNPFKITALNIRKSTKDPVNLIEADLTLTALVK